MSFQDELMSELKDYISDLNFLAALGISENAEIEFLAQGEYNINYLLKDGEDKLVLRLNMDSQMSLDDQISYEFESLKELSASGVTPRPYYLDSSKDKLPYGMLVMEYLEGRTLNYEDDLKRAAEIFAEIHSLVPSKNSYIIKEEKPITAIWEECSSLLDSYFDSEKGDNKLKDTFKKIKKELFKLKEEKESELIDILPFSIVNTEVNSGNFIIDTKKEKNYLVDWEKPLITSPLQDLSHFMVPTTTLWKTNFLFNQGETEEFLHHYINARKIDLDYYELFSKLKIFNYFSAMRGISWSAMAWIEYQKPERLIKNEDTFRTIESYLNEDFIEMLFEDIL